MSARVPRITKECQCGRSFQLRESQAKRKKFCSLPCKLKFYTKRSGFTRKDNGRNASWFSEGCKPWNAGTIGLISPNAGSFQKGVRANPTTEFKKGEMVGASNPKWKGDAVRYDTLHNWVKRRLGKAIRCEKGKGAEHRSPFQWANKSREYKRDLEDWVQLCCRCHIRYDSGPARGAIKRKYGPEWRKVI